MSQRSGANLLLNGQDIFDWASDERGSSVGDGLTSILAHSGATNFDGVHLELPITATSHGHVSEVAFIPRGIGSTKDDLSYEYK